MDKRIVAEFVVREGREEQVQEAIDKLVQELNDTSYRGSGFRKPIKRYRKGIRGRLTEWRR